MDRGIFENSIWNDVIEFRIFFYIVGNAIWKEEGVNMGNIHIKRGQYLRSYRRLKDDLMYIENNAIKYYSVSTIKRKVDKLVNDGRLETEETELGTLFTVVNYNKYQWLQGVKTYSLEQPQNSNETPTEQPWNNKNKDNTDNKDIYITTAIEDEKLETENYNPVADIGADPIQQEEGSVAQVGVDTAKQINSVEQIERVYLKIRNRNTCSSNDMVNMVEVYEKYKDLNFIIKTMKIAAEDNKARNGRLTINSFSYFMPIFQDEWEKLNLQKKKEGVKDGPTRANSKQNIKFDKSQFFWNGGENSI